MIVIFLIGLIGSVIGYNVKGSLEEGKAFRTEQGAAQIEDILSLEAANGTSPQEIVDNAEAYLKKSGLCKNPTKLLKDGWGKPYEIKTTHNGTRIKISSEALKKHRLKKGQIVGNASSNQDPEDDDNEEE